MDEKKLALMLKALGDENRIRILRQLRQGEKCACRLLEDLEISQPTLSHHMKILCEAGIVQAHKEGKWMYYSICCEGVCQLRGMLKELLMRGIMPDDCRCEEE